jgi:hypothetical protein
MHEAVTIGWLRGPDTFLMLYTPPASRRLLIALAIFKSL